MVKGSIKYQLNQESGKRTGHAAVLFDTESDAERAMKDLQKKEIGGRWIILNDLDLEEHETFEKFSLNEKNIRCSEAITESNCARCVKIKGLPWTANKKAVQEFFGDFKVSKTDITIDVQNGKNTGYAVIQLTDEAEAQRAIKELDRKEIGNRWIGVFAAEVR